jgi:hypothetical protein
MTDDLQPEAQAQREMPKYKCHKEVWALQIKYVQIFSDSMARVTHGMIFPMDVGYAPFSVPLEYLQKHLAGLTEEQINGGYFVEYYDGYKSFSPRKAFEDGYTRI